MGRGRRLPSGALKAIDNSTQLPPQLQKSIDQQLKKFQKKKKKKGEQSQETDPLVRLGIRQPLIEQDVKVRKNATTTPVPLTEEEKLAHLRAKLSLKPKTLFVPGKTAEEVEESRSSKGRIMQYAKVTIKNDMEVPIKVWWKYFGKEQGSKKLYPGDYTERSFGSFNLFHVICGRFTYYKFAPDYVNQRKLTHLDRCKDAKSPPASNHHHYKTSQIFDPDLVLLPPFAKFATEDKPAEEVDWKYVDPYYLELQNDPLQPGIEGAFIAAVVALALFGLEKRMRKLQEFPTRMQKPLLHTRAWETQPVHRHYWFPAIPYIGNPDTT
eukprot:gnl/MRDRNA2_/MRDRNA2_79142_c0_seq1.p1 gnl/MRDRNA2_/MRDRNA2_79142_c0~~gnl/MRDRNA2_/MRDRNA2_79142_c0_seq1.p1  ORF type:complete len:324 (-),score=65.34 gnl/MRDRNA2_/MRDRNA2_79142_c0_seq1:127-1098(-)